MIGYCSACRNYFTAGCEVCNPRTVDGYTNTPPGRVAPLTDEEIRQLREILRKALEQANDQ